jgi:hypothetical protein
LGGPGDDVVFSDHACGNPLYAGGGGYHTNDWCVIDPGTCKGGTGGGNPGPAPKEKGADYFVETAACVGAGAGAGAASDDDYAAGDDEEWTPDGEDGGSSAAAAAASDADACAAAGGTWVTTWWDDCGTNFVSDTATGAPRANASWTAAELRAVPALVARSAAAPDDVAWVGLADAGAAPPKKTRKPGDGGGGAGGAGGGTALSAETVAIIVGSSCAVFAAAVAVRRWAVDPPPPPRRVVGGEEAGATKEVEMLEHRKNPTENPMAADDPAVADEGTEFVLEL